MSTLEIDDTLTIEMLQKNDYDYNIPASISRNFGNDAILSDPSNYFMCISRFVVPLSSIELIKLDTVEDYYIDMSIPWQDTAGNASVTSKTGRSYFFPRSLQKIYTPDQYIAQINRSMYESYVNLCSTISPSLFKKTVVSSGLSYNTGTTSRNISVTGLSGNNCLFSSLKLSGFVNALSNDNPFVSIYLVNPNGDKCLVCASVKLESNKTYVFDDLQVGVSNHLSSLDINYNGIASYKPTEFFYSKYYNSSGNGNWSLQFVPSSNNALDFTINTELTIQHAPYVLNRYDFSSLFPSYSLDKSTGFLSINLFEKFLISGIIIQPSAKLLSLLSLEKVPSSTNIYLEQRPLTYSPGNPIITIQAQSPKLYLMSEIDQLILESNNLCISRDISPVSNVFSNSISSFVISSDEILNFNQGAYSYDGSRDKLKRYRFKPSSPALYELNLKFTVKYNDNSREELILRPGESCNALIHIYL